MLWQKQCNKNHYAYFYISLWIHYNNFFKILKLIFGILHPLMSKLKPNCFKFVDQGQD
jgi:hypothetical protein